MKPEVSCAPAAPRASRITCGASTASRHAEANPVSQTVTVRYDEAALTADDVRALIERFGCSCGGEIVPCHLCRDEQPAVIGSTVAAWRLPHTRTPVAHEHAGHAMAAPARGRGRRRDR